VNGHTPGQNWTGVFRPGETVRLRLINASAMTFFDVRLPGLEMIVVSADGREVKPVTVDELRIGPAETYDVLVKPQEDKAYTFAAEAMDRTGFALATLAPRTGMKGPVPAPRPRARLTMTDMGMEHIHHSGMAHDMANMPPSGWAQTGAPEGTRVLSYEDLKALHPQPDTRQPERELEVRLGGNMERYIWTLNGRKYSEAGPIALKHGERVRLKFVNETMMAHPMHLHGMFLQLENGNDAAEMPDKHTVIVPPGQTVTALLTADALGEWAFHCHLLYHMMSGMMNKVVVAHVDGPAPAPAASSEEMHHHAH
jgi:FtsP/CotA-like multicopper oxidase with cupredoxin domain